MIARAGPAARPSHDRPHPTAPHGALHQGDPPMIARPARADPQPVPEETRP